MRGGKRLNATSKLKGPHTAKGADNNFLNWPSGANSVKKRFHFLHFSNTLFDHKSSALSVPVANRGVTQLNYNQQHIHVYRDLKT